MTVTLIYRKTTPHFFSIEKVFSLIRDEVATNVKVDTIELPYTSKGIISIILNLLFLKWKTRNLDTVFHITGDVHYAILALPAERTILTIHDLVFLHSYKGFTRKFLKWIFLDLPLRKAPVITTISEKSKKEILQYSSFPSERIYVISNPVSEKLTASKTNLSDRIEQGSHSFRLLFLGTKPNKNLEASIASLYKLNIHLRIIGAITDHQHHLLKKFHIDHSIAQQLTDEALSAEYDQADAILFPSTYEGFGLPLLEGFQSRKPVITSNIPPMKDIAGDAAVLVEPYAITSIRKAVQQLIDEPALHIQLKEKGSIIAKQYEPRHIADAYHKIWTHVWNSRDNTL